MRTKEEIEQEIHNLQMDLLYLEMKDTWDHVDYDEADQIRKQIEKLEVERDAKREAIRE